MEGGGKAEQVPKARRDRERRSPGASPALSLGASLLLLPDPGVSTQRLFPPPLALLPTRWICEGQQSLH